MPELPVKLPEETIARLRFAAKMSGRTEGEIIAVLVDSMSAGEVDAEDHGDGRKEATRTPVPVYAVYEGNRVEGEFHPETGTLVITSPPWSGERFRSASSAASAVVRNFKPNVGSANRSGNEFWRQSGEGTKLGALRGR
ncbi:hypothetical protein [Marinitenerispora sediminis]|nr:hypothetical protein [Marinitenerispora sediminis]